MNIIISFLIITSFSSIFAADISKCNVNYSKNGEEYINSVLNELYYSIEGIADELDAGLNFGNERFPFQLSFNLNKSEMFSHIPLTLTLEDLMNGLKKRANYDFDGHDKVFQVTNMYQQYVNILKDLIEKNQAFKSRITIHDEILTPVTAISEAHFSFYSDIKTLKKFLDYLMKTEIKSVFGSYDTARIIFHAKQYRTDQVRRGEKGLSMLSRRKDWFEGVEHFKVIRENSRGTPHERIAEELNLYEMTMQEIENKRYVYKTSDIQKILDNEVMRIKLYRAEGQVYFKNKHGQNTYNWSLLRNLIEENFVNKKKTVEEIMHIINKELNQLPYNRYLFVPITENETSKLIYYMLNTLSPNEVAALMFKNKNKDSN